MKKARICLAVFLICMSTLAATGCKEQESSYKSLDSATAAEVAQIASEDSRLTGELENKKIKWMATWDINPDSTGKATPIELEIFKSRYGGEIEYYNVDYNTRYESLAMAVAGGEGIDFFSANDLDAFPRGAIKEMFVPIDDYIDFNDPLFAGVKDTADLFQWNGKHYVLVNDVTGDNCVVIYNRDTIEENGLEDPAKLFAEGKWDWNAFQNQLKQFVDVDNEQYGIDGWWYEGGLSATCGVPYIGIQNGKLVNNLKDPAIERLQNWMYDMGVLNYVCVDENGWKEKPTNIGEGKELYYPCGAWALFKEKSQWSAEFGENVMFVPMPKDPNADQYYIPCGLDGYMMVKNGQNPEGVAKFAACKRMAITNERAAEIGTEQLAKDYGWTDEMVQMLHKCHEMAKANTHYDFYNAVSTDVSDILDSNDLGGIRSASKGMNKWSESVGAVYSAIDAYIDEYNSKQ